PAQVEPEPVGRRQPGELADQLERVVLGAGAPLGDRPAGVDADEHCVLRIAYCVLRVTYPPYALRITHYALRERRDPGDVAADGERVHLVGALVGVDALEVAHMAEDREFEADAAGAEDAARFAGDLERGADVVSLG